MNYIIKIPRAKPLYYRAKVTKKDIRLSNKTIYLHKCIDTPDEQLFYKAKTIDVEDILKEYIGSTIFYSDEVLDKQKIMELYPEEFL